MYSLLELKNVVLIKIEAIVWLPKYIIDAILPVHKAYI